MIQGSFALVTGGSRGIGRAICLKLAQMGYGVIVNYDTNVGAAKETVELVERIGQPAYALPFNIANKEDIRERLGGWLQEHPDRPIEVLVNNAGVRQDALMTFMSDEQWEDVMRIDLSGMYYVTQMVLRSMLLKRFGRIVNIASLSGLKGMPGQVNYSAAKAGMIGATKALAQEVAKRNVTVNAVAPGFIKTDMTGDLNEKEWEKSIPMGRFGTAEEVAGLVGFLASREASYLTGQVISVNGGLYT